MAIRYLYIDLKHNELLKAFKNLEEVERWFCLPKTHIEYMLKTRKQHGSCLLIKDNTHENDIADNNYYRWIRESLNISEDRMCEYLGIDKKDLYKLEKTSEMKATPLMFKKYKVLEEWLND